MRQFSPSASPRPVDERPSSSRWLLLAGLLLLLLLAHNTRAQAPVVRTVGTTGEYPTIMSALLDAPADAPYELHLLDVVHTEDVSIAQAFPAAAPLTIRPANGATVAWTGTLTLENTAANVTVDGSNGVAARALTLVQPNASRSTVRVQGGQGITLRALIIQGSAAGTSGVVALEAIGTTQLELRDNLIRETEGGALPAYLLHAGSASQQVLLQHNEFRNFTTTAVAVLPGNGSNWTIADNSFYYTLPTAPSSAQTAIDFQPGAASDNNSIAGNYIGGRGPETAGGIWENTGANDFHGIIMSASTGSNTLSGNFIRNITLSRQNTTQALTALLVAAGAAQLTGNTISGVANSGTKGVNSLTARGTVTLGNFTVNSGQIMSAEGNELTVTGNLTINGILNHTQGDMLVQGNFTNRGTFAQTRGDLVVQGDMINTYIFNCSGGAVRLTGNQDQKVSGGAYFNLEVNGTGTKTLTGTVTVYNGVQMTVGTLNTGLYKISLSPLANLVETNDSYVLGQVEAAGRVTEEEKTEDFGNIGLTLTPLPGSGLPAVTALRTTGVQNTGQIGRVFSLSGDGTPGLRAAMTMRYFDHEATGLDTDKLEFFSSADNGAIWSQEGISSSQANLAVLNEVTSLGLWTLGVVDKPLPVTLTSFTAQADGAQAVIRWATALEVNADGFAVEVSTNGQTFRRLGYVRAAGHAQQYRFTDTEPRKTGARYYRLRQQDTDGRFSYSAVRSVSFGAAQGLSLAAYPNPSSGPVNLQLTAPKAGPVTLRLLDNLGRVVWTHTALLNPGANALTLQPTCAAGTYVLEASQQQQLVRQRLVRH